MRHLMKRMLNAVFRGPRVSPSVPVPPPSPAPDAGPLYERVMKADAIAELSQVTGDRQADDMRGVLIDCIQHGYLETVRGEDGELQFGITPAGRERIWQYWLG